MKVKLFDCDHEKDLELEVNSFLKTIDDEMIVDIKYSVATLYDYQEQIYCYTAMIIYND